MLISSNQTNHHDTFAKALRDPLVWIDTAAVLLLFGGTGGASASVAASASNPLIPSLWVGSARTWLSRGGMAIGRRLRNRIFMRHFWSSSTTVAMRTAAASVPTTSSSITVLGGTTSGGHVQRLLRRLSKQTLHPVWKVVRKLYRKRTRLSTLSDCTYFLETPSDNNKSVGD